MSQRHCTTLYTVSQKNKTPNSCPYLRQISTDFQSSFTNTLSRKFAINRLNQCSLISTRRLSLSATDSINIVLVRCFAPTSLLYRPKPIHCNYQFVHYSGFCRISPSILNRFKPNLQAYSVPNNTSPCIFGAF